MAAKATDTLAKLSAVSALKQSDLDEVAQHWHLAEYLILDEEILEITRDNSISLVTNINGQKYTAVQVARSYRKTSTKAQRIVG